MPRGDNTEVSQDRIVREGSAQKNEDDRRVFNAGPHPHSCEHSNEPCRYICDILYQGQRCGTYPQASSVKELSS